MCSWQEQNSITEQLLNKLRSIMNN